jgi:hypothetical protein
MQRNLKVDEYISLVEHAIDCGLEAEKIESNPNFVPKTKLHKSGVLSLNDLNGMSRAEVRIFLNELIKEDTNYLEIGLYKGSTFVSALYKNKFKSAVGIDSFKNFEGEKGDDILQNFLKSCARFKIGNFTLIRNDSFSLTDENKKNINDINVYFYDGGHSYVDHYLALKDFYKHLSDVFIFIVDDWVHPPAVDGTLKAIEHLELKVHKKWELGHSQHLRGELPGLSWHNGLYVAVLEK